MKKIILMFSAILAVGIFAACEKLPEATEENESTAPAETALVGSECIYENKDNPADNTTAHILGSKLHMIPTQQTAEQFNMLIEGTTFKMWRLDTNEGVESDIKEAAVKLGGKDMLSADDFIDFFKENGKCIEKELPEEMFEVPAEIKMEPAV